MDITLSNSFSNSSSRSAPQQGPKFGKKSLSFYLRNECPRQFRLSLYDQRLLQSGNMPKRSSNRPLSGQAAQAGDEWQNRVVGEVQNIFGSANVRVNPTPPPPQNSGKVQRPPQRELDLDMDNLEPNQFVVESIFELTNSFKSAFGLHDIRDSDNLKLEWSRLNPDIIQVLPPKPDSLLVTSDGKLLKMAADDSLCG